MSECLLVLFEKNEKRGIGEKLPFSPLLFPNTFTGSDSYGAGATNEIQICVTGCLCYFWCAFTKNAHCL